MAFNIMDLVKDQLTPDNLGAIARMLGEDDKKTAAGMAGVVTLRSVQVGIPRLPPAPTQGEPCTMAMPLGALLRL